MFLKMINCLAQWFCRMLNGFVQGSMVFLNGFVCIYSRDPNKRTGGNRRTGEKLDQGILACFAEFYFAIYPQNRR
jgi:hypothetical protein